MHLDRIYAYRMGQVNQEERIAAWRPISAWVMRQLGHPHRILEVGAGRCEFINQCGAEERWAVDLDPDVARYAAPGVKLLIGRLRDVDFGGTQFPAVFMSNFLEHLASPTEVDEVLCRIHELLEPGGRVGILGPNYKYSYRKYFDFADHVLPLTHITVSEFLYGAGFEKIRAMPKTLPFSFRSRLPIDERLVRLYLSCPWSWRIMGRQFFVVGTKD